MPPLRLQRGGRDYRFAFRAFGQALRSSAANRFADAFAWLSDHEDFRVPLLEAMEAALPIVADDAGARNWSQRRLPSPCARSSHAPLDTEL